MFRPEEAIPEHEEYEAAQDFLSPPMSQSSRPATPGSGIASQRPVTPRAVARSQSQAQAQPRHIIVASGDEQQICSMVQVQGIRVQVLGIGGSVR